MVKNAAFSRRRSRGETMRVLVAQQQPHRPHAQPARHPKIEQPPEPHQQPQHRQVHPSRRPKGRRQPVRLRHAAQSHLPVMLVILAGVKHVEPRHPQRHRRRQHQNPRV